MHVRRDSFMYDMNLAYQYVHLCARHLLVNVT